MISLFKMSDTVKDIPWEVQVNSDLDELRTWCSQNETKQFNLKQRVNKHDDDIRYLLKKIDELEKRDDYLEDLIDQIFKKIESRSTPKKSDDDDEWIPENHPSCDSRDSEMMDDHKDSSS